MYVTKLNTEIYKCIASNIATEDVIITDKQLEHISSHHPDAYNQVLIELQGTISNPDIILRDRKHMNTGLVIRELASEHGKLSLIVLRVCTDSLGGKYCNTIISGWKIGRKRLGEYLRNEEILYIKSSAMV